MTLLARLAALFVEPAAPAAIPPSPPPAPDLTVLLAAGEDLAASAGGVAEGLRRAARARAAVVLSPSRAMPRIATPGAAALARRLGARDVAAVAADALCHVELPDVGAPAVVRRVAAAVDVPLLVALPARDEGLDGLLATADRLLLALPASTSGDLAEVALASLAALGPPVMRVAPPAGFIARRLAAAGLKAVPLDATPESFVAIAPVAPRFEPPRAELRA